METNLFEFIVKYIYPPLVLIAGLLGNVLGFIVFSSKSSEKIGPRNIYRYLMIMDTVYLIQIVNKYLKYAFRTDLAVTSVELCQTTKYFAYCLDAISPMLLVYISIERLISIKYPASKVLREVKTQLIFLSVVIAYNLIFYIPIPIFHNIIVDYKANTTRCDFISNEELFWIIDMANLIIIPFLLMIFFSIALIYLTFKLRNRIMKTFLTKDYKTYKKDIKLSVTCLSLNIFYLVLNLPFGVLNFTSKFEDNLSLFTIYLFYTSYSVSFYVILISNTLIRKQTFKIFHCRKRIIPEIVVSDLSTT